MPTFLTVNHPGRGNPGQEERIRALLAVQFGVDAASIGVQDSIVEDLYADSLELLDMCLSLNTVFEIDIGAKELATMKTVGDVYRVVARMRGAVEEDAKAVAETEEDGEVCLGMTDEMFVSRLANVRTLS